MELVADIVSWAFILSGSFFVLTGGIGLLRMPDLYTRMHAAGLTDTLGAALLLAGLMVQSGFTLIAVKLVLILIFLLITSPTASHALAHAAYHAGVKPILADDTDDEETGSSKS